MRCFWIALACVFSLFGEQRQRVVVVPSEPGAVENFRRKDSSSFWKKAADNLALQEIKMDFRNLDARTSGLKSSSIKYVIFHNISSEGKKAIDKIPLKKRVLWIWEPAVVRPDLYKEALHSKFWRIYTWDDTLVDEKKYHKFYYHKCAPMRKNQIPFHERRFCCLVNANKKAQPQKKWLDYYAERKKTICFFEKFAQNDFDLYGRGWQNLLCYKGVCRDKVETIKQYKFCICYENTNTPGYITEKIFDCFCAGVVPVYLGAENVTQYIPESCFIDRRKFKTHDELYSFLKSIDEKKFEEYLSQIKAYLKTEQARLFSAENLMETFVSSIQK